MSLASFSFIPIFLATTRISSKFGFLPSPFIVVACSPLKDELYVKS